eukprot:SAG22_NODE_3175_length_1878_cov_2.569421_2_plen_218_part_01
MAAREQDLGREAEMAPLAEMAGGCYACVDDSKGEFEGCSGQSSAPSPPYQGDLTSQTCEPVSCDVVDTSSSGTAVVGSTLASGCACAAGYSGTITATAVEPYFSGSCVAVGCPPNSVDMLGNNNTAGLPGGCACSPGYHGSLTATSTEPYFEGDECSMNECACSNGAAASADLCPVHGSETCLSCDAGYALSDAGICEAVGCDVVDTSSSGTAVVGST